MWNVNLGYSSEPGSSRMNSVERGRELGTSHLPRAIDLVVVVVFLRFPLNVTLTQTRGQFVC